MTKQAGSTLTDTAKVVSLLYDTIKQEEMVIGRLAQEWFGIFLRVIRASWEHGGYLKKPVKSLPHLFPVP